MKNRVAKIAGITAGVLLILGLSGCMMDTEIIHEHTYSKEWTTNDDYHWHEATCEHSDEVSGKDLHTWDDGEVTTAATETSEGVKTFKCTVCSKTKTEVIAKLSHKHSYKEEWVSDATQHWHECTGCKEKGSAENHEFENGKCKVCGAKKASAEEKTEEDPVIVAGKYDNDKNPLVSSTASVSQDFIFSLDSIGITKINIRRSEWNKMLSYYDYFYKNENSVIAESYEYEKAGQTWKLNTVGLRLRGNTSRYRPQGKDNPEDGTGRRQPNGDWNKDYYNYAKTCSDDAYRQSHFKIDFEPLDDDDRKMSDCMKGVALKRCDSYFSKEIFCYNLLHKYGIWTAPRASQTKVYINIIEDVGSNGSAKQDISNCSVTRLDYGVYEMFEEVNKQSLKGRMKKNGNNNASTAWANNDGDLWKCSGGDLTADSNRSENFGCEKIKILNTDKDKSQWEAIWYGPCYDLKTNKKKVDEAAVKFQGFLTELNNLSNTTADTTQGTNARKAFYEKWFDVDFFIKTYAVDILCGMDDDYWGNANNYYLYFDNGKGGSGKCYLIPFDYDNTLGSSITGDKVCTDPFKWGNDHDRPLLDRLLEVPEYKEKMKAALLEVSSQDSTSPWNKINCIATWNKMHANVRSYVYSPNLKGWPDISSISVEDAGGWKQDTTQKHYLTQDYENIYEQVTNNIKYWIENSGDATGKNNVTFVLNGADKLMNIVNNREEYTPIGSDPTITYTGAALNLNKMLGGTPYKEGGYVFKGWTRTNDAADTDYIEYYSTNMGVITLYAKYRDLSSDKIKKTINGVGYTNEVSIEVKAESDGLHIKKSNSELFNHLNIQFTNATTGKSLIYLDNIDKDGNYIQTDWFVYPFVTAGHVYNIKFEFMDDGYHNYHTVEVNKITAKGGEGDVYVNCSGYTYNKTAKTITLHNFEKSDNTYKSNFIVGMFDTDLWAGGEHCYWDYRWKLEDTYVPGNDMTIKCYEYDWNNNDYSNEATWFDNKAKHFIYVGYEFWIGDSQDGELHFRDPLIEAQIWPN